MRCAVFASGSGSNFQALINRKKSGDLHAELSLLVVNNSSAGAVVRAQQAGISSVHCPPTRFKQEKDYVAVLTEHLQAADVELIVLAGYMKKLPIVIVRMFANRIINIHPGLLPAFGGKGMYGKRVHQAVLDYGAKISGVTVHFVDEEYDHGPILLQETVPVLDNDDVAALAERVLALEHATYWRAVEALSRGGVRVEGRRVLGVI